MRRSSLRMATFAAKPTGMAGPGVSVWRHLIGAAGLKLWSPARGDSRDPLSPLREDWRSLVPLSLMGVSLDHLLCRWALDFATVMQVATDMGAPPAPARDGETRRAVRRRRLRGPCPLARS